MTAASHIWNVERVVKEAATNLEMARSLHQIASANGALTLIADLHGYRIQRIEGHVQHDHALSELSVQELRDLALAVRGKLVDGTAQMGDVPEPGDLLPLRDEIEAPEASSPPQHQGRPINARKTSRGANGKAPCLPEPAPDPDELPAPGTG